MPRAFIASFVAALTLTVLVGVPFSLFALVSGIFDVFTMPLTILGLFALSWSYIGLVGVPVFFVLRRVMAFNYGRAFWLGMTMGVLIALVFASVPVEEAPPSFPLGAWVVSLVIGFAGGVAGLAFWDSWSRRTAPKES